MKKFEEEIRENILEILVSNTGSSLYGQSYLNYDAVVELSEGWISPEDHQAEVGKIELQNLKYREEIARMQKSLRKKNKAIKELNGAVKKSKVRLKECEDLRIEANNSAAMEYARKCEVVEDRAELKREIDKLKSQLENQPEIPEVPQFVADWLESDDLEDLIDDWYNHTSQLPEKVRDYLDSLGEDATTFEDCYKETVHLIARAKLDGYTVETPKVIVSPCPVCGFEDVEENFCGICGHKNEYVEVAKEKRFYLKHIEMSKRDTYHDYYAQIRNERFEHDSVESGTLP